MAKKIYHIRVETITPEGKKTEKHLSFDIRPTYDVLKKYVGVPEGISLKNYVKSNSYTIGDQNTFNINVDEKGFYGNNTDTIYTVEVTAHNLKLDTINKKTFAFDKQPTGRDLRNYTGLPDHFTDDDFVESSRITNDDYEFEIVVNESQYIYEKNWSGDDLNSSNKPVE